MGRRSRSRSPHRERRRSRSRDRDRDREKKRRRHRSRTPPGGAKPPRRRSRSFSPGRRRSRSPPPGYGKRGGYEGGEPSRAPPAAQPPAPRQQFLPRPQISESDMEGKTEEEIEMMKLMGFGGFDSTKGKKVTGNETNYAANVTHKRKYRQYMNRRGGFNRPLDFIA